jgi:Ser/Thr protein kinase RdoA (MazF antagonist)
VIVLEDMTTSPCQFPDTLRPLDNDQMGQLIECFARLHATFWGRLPEKSCGGGHFDWLIAPSSDPTNPITPKVMRMSARRLAARTMIPVYTGRFLWENFQTATEVIDAGPHTVLHGDAHPGNTYFRDGCAGLLDWQVVRRGHPARDLAYTMILGMRTDDRRAAEHDLLDTYRQALAANRGPDLDADELFARYRQAALHPYVSALATAGLGGMQADDVAVEGLRRAIAALEDLDTVRMLCADITPSTRRPVAGTPRALRRRTG